jgi:hypothetical protein
MKPISTRYLRLENVHMAAGLFAISGFRVFGIGPGGPPANVTGVVVWRQSDDRRHARISWTPSPRAYAYNISFGIAPGKRYSNIMVYGTTSYEMRGFDISTRYYVAVEAVGEGGISPGGRVVEVP